MVAQSLTVLQLTDTHLYETADRRMYGVKTYDTLAETVQRVSREVPQLDAILLTGDISQDETAASYANVSKLVKQLGAPIYYLPGNHDNWEEMDNAFRCQGPPFKPARDFYLSDDWYFILLNSVKPGCVEGLLSVEELERLRHALDEKRAPNYFVSLHHHPCSVGSPFDQIGLENNADLFSILDEHPEVRVVLFGHIHQEFELWHKPTHLRMLGSPSTCVQFKPRAERFEIDALAPGYRVIRLYSDGSIDTYIDRLAHLPDGLRLGPTKASEEGE